MRVAVRVEETPQGSDKTALYEILFDTMSLATTSDRGLADAFVRHANRIVAAWELVEKHHGDQMHGSVPITMHLEAVMDRTMDAMLDEGYYDAEDPDDVKAMSDVVIAAILHDALEDTALTLKEIGDAFGPWVAMTVMLLTDKPGASRYERHLNTYWLLREAGGEAVMIKLCDRWHNHLRSLKFNEHYCKMYADEYPYFKMALWRPGEHVKLWADLDEQYRHLKEMADGAGLQEGKPVGKHPGAGEAPDGAKPGKVRRAQGRNG